MNLAVIPARGGSKRIPRKNTKEFLGKPIIAYSIEAARESGLFDAIVVSTDDEEISRIAEAHGAAVPFRRPAELANDTAATVPVIQHAIVECRRLGLGADHVCCIYPCAPCLTPDDLKESYDLLRRNEDERFIFPVARFPSSIERALRRGEAGETRPARGEFAETRTQDLSEAFYDAGQFYWGSVDAWLSGRPIHSHARTIIVPPWRAVDIDTPEDWAFAELLAAAARAQDR